MVEYLNNITSILYVERVAVRKEIFFFFLLNLTFRMLTTRL
jgi:hypothetical protein